jgi:hypothetical protein
MIRRQETAMNQMYKELLIYIVLLLTTMALPYLFTVILK